MLAKFKKVVIIQAQLSLGIGYATYASVPHSLGNGFLNLATVFAMTGYRFLHSKIIFEATKSAQAAGAWLTTAAEEAEDVDMGGLFGDDDKK